MQLGVLTMITFYRMRNYKLVNTKKTAYNLLMLGPETVKLGTLSLG